MITRANIRLQSIEIFSESSSHVNDMFGKLLFGNCTIWNDESIIKLPRVRISLKFHDGRSITFWRKIKNGWQFCTCSFSAASSACLHLNSESSTSVWTDKFSDWTRWNWNQILEGDRMHCQWQNNTLVIQQRWWSNRLVNSLASLSRTGHVS